MYWLRDFNPLVMLAFTGLCLLWSAGGWLLVTHAFHLRSRERLVAGLALGFLLFITLSNLLSNLFPLTLAFWLGGLSVLVMGVWPALRARRRVVFFWRDWRAWSLLLALVFLTLIFARVQRGLALFDEYLHLPLVSLLAAGDMPPHFYLDPEVLFAYHYGLQVFSAALVRLGGFFPWSALDLSKALGIALTSLLAWMWILRLTRSRLAAALGSFALLFAGGARWLLLFLPPAWLEAIGQSVIPINTGANTGSTLLEVLTSHWKIAGGGPIPFPFAFHSGIFVPLFFALANTGAMMHMTILLLLLLYRRQRPDVVQSLIYCLLLASLALSAEHLFAFFWGGLLLVMTVEFWRSRKPAKISSPPSWPVWLSILAASAVMSALQGGYVTETLRAILNRLLGQEAAAVNTFLFSLRWPPALPTGHLSDLSILYPPQLLVLLSELGPVLLLAPMATAWAYHQLRNGNLTAGAFGVAALLNFFFPLFIQYGVDRSSTRMPATALWLWLALGWPALSMAFKKASAGFQWGVVAGYVAALFPGLVIFAVQVNAIPVPQISYYLTGLDSAVSRDYWNRLPENAQVLDRDASRSVTLFGRASRAYSEIYTPYPEWVALTLLPVPEHVRAGGYDFVYFDRSGWQDLNPELRQAYTQGCARLLEEYTLPEGDFRRLYDLRACEKILPDEP